MGVEIVVSDSRGVAKAQAEAMDRASRGAWRDGDTSASSASRAADLRALVAATYRVCAQLGAPARVRIVYEDSQTLPDGTIVMGATATLVVDGIPTDPGAYATPDHYRTVAGLLLAPRALADRTGEPAPPDGAKLHVANDDAGAWPITAIVTVALLGAAVVAGSTYILCAKSDEVVDRDLARNTNARIALQSHTDLLTLATEHAAREAAAGHPLPYDDAERAALDAIIKTHGEATQRLANEKPAAPPKGIGNAIADAVPLFLLGGLLLTAATTENRP